MPTVSIVRPDRVPWIPRRAEVWCGPLVVGRPEGMHELGRATVDVLAVQFATPRTTAQGTTTVVLSSDRDGRVRAGVHLTPHVSES